MHHTVPLAYRAAAEHQQQVQEEDNFPLQAHVLPTYVLRGIGKSLEPRASSAPSGSFHRGRTEPCHKPHGVGTATSGALPELGAVPVPLLEQGHSCPIPPAASAHAPQTRCLPSGLPSPAAFGSIGQRCLLEGQRQRWEGRAPISAHLVADILGTVDEEQATERTEDAGGGPLTPPTQSLHHLEVSLVHLAGTAACPSPWGRERGPPPSSPLGVRVAGRRRTWSSKGCRSRVSGCLSTARRARWVLARRRSRRRHGR